MTQETPRELGYKMPAEWAAHSSTWIAWPHNSEDWPGKFQPIPWAYAEMVRHLTRVEEVHILAMDAAMEKRARNILMRAGANLARVHFHLWRTDRVWLRDSGPIFLKNAAGEIALTNWKFNAWAKYDNWQADDKVPANVAKFYGMREWQPMVGERRVVLEGGSIDVNGAGMLLTTEECLLSEVQQRNPGVSREALENCFREYLGVEQTIWLHRGIAGDDTHGHIDDIARFADERTVIAVVEKNIHDENHLPLEENLERLHAVRTRDGQPLKVVKLPLPAPVVFEGQRLPASYANFYIANGLVLVPTFNDANDRVALNVIAECFPQHEVVGIYCGDFIWGLGALHCATQQEPA